MAWSSFNSGPICHVLPVLRMALCFQIKGQWAKIKHDILGAIFRRVPHVAAPGAMFDVYHYLVIIIIIIID